MFECHPPPPPPPPPTEVRSRRPISGIGVDDFFLRKVLSFSLVVRFLPDDDGADVDGVVGVAFVSFGVVTVLAFPLLLLLLLLLEGFARAPDFAVAEVSAVWCSDGDEAPTAAPDLVSVPSTDSSASTLESARTDFASSASAMSWEGPIKRKPAPATRVRVCVSRRATLW